MIRNKLSPSLSIYCIDDEFATWAFGKEIWNGFLVFDYDCIDLFEAWNKLHSDLLELDELAPIIESINKMKQLWIEHA